ncbi:MAG: MaoC/PaaZ C-terminal domain-containing protein [Polyangiaceae bacterium]
MALDLGCVGTTSGAHTLRVDWRTLATYALGIGAKRDELDYLYEGTEGGMQVYPTFAVVPAFGPVFECLARTGGDVAMVVHGAQTVAVREPMPRLRGVEAIELSTTGKLEALYDLKKFGQAIVRTETSLDGRVLFETSWMIIYRGGGNFGGPRPPADHDVPSVPKDRDADFTATEVTTAEQALLYRLSGDQNPLHADPAFAARVGFEQGPILHGLCTFGFLGRAVVRHACGGDPTKLERLVAGFKKPVWPGDALTTKGFRLEGPSEQRIALTTSVLERGEVVLGSAYAQIARSDVNEQSM